MDQSMKFPLISIYHLYLPPNAQSCSIRSKAWAAVEASQHRKLASYAMTRLQRNRGVRWDFESILMSL